MSNRSKGWSSLAAAIIIRAKADNDTRFFKSAWYEDLAMLAELNITKIEQANPVVHKMRGEDVPFNFM